MRLIFHLYFIPLYFALRFRREGVARSKRRNRQITAARVHAPEVGPRRFFESSWNYNWSLREDAVGVAALESGNIIMDIEYWRHETNFVYVNWDMNETVGWVTGFGYPAFLRDDMLAWRSRAETTYETYYCRIVDCEMLPQGYHKCVAEQAAVSENFAQRFNRYVEQYKSRGWRIPTRADCPAHVYVKDLCPSIAPRRGTVPVCTASETSGTIKGKICEDTGSAWESWAQNVSQMAQNATERLKGRLADGAASAFRAYERVAQFFPSFLEKSTTLTESFDHTQNATLKGITTCTCQAGSCYVRQPWGFCTPIVALRADEVVNDIFASVQPVGVRVCLNSESAPACDQYANQGRIYRNRLRVIFRDIYNQIRPQFNVSKAPDLADRVGHSRYYVYECEYLVYNCKIQKWLGFAWDTSIGCEWMHVGRIDYPKLPPDPWECPPLNIGDHSSMVFITFYDEVSSYAPAQFVKTWGAGGPMKTAYDTCGMQLCDFSCTRNPETCLFKCCKNSLFVTTYGHLPLRPLPGQEMTFRQACLAVGYLRDPLINLEELSAIAEQQVANVFLVTLKMLTTPPFNMIWTVTPTQWLIFGIGVALADWAVAHSTVTAFHTVIDEFTLFDGHPLALLKGRAIILAGAPDDGSENSVSCKLMVGFVFVFLQSLVKCLGALLGQAMIGGALGIHAGTGDITFGISEHGGNLQSEALELIGAPIQAILDASGYGEKIRGFFQGKVFGWLFGGLLWQINNFVGGQTGQVLATTIVGNLFRTLMKTTQICTDGGPTLQSWDQVFDQTKNFIVSMKAKVGIQGFLAEATPKQKQEQQELVQVVRYGGKIPEPEGGS